MPRRKDVEPTLPPPRLLIARIEAKQRLTERIERGVALAQLRITNQQEYELALQQFRKWDDFNSEFLKRAFDNETFAKEYDWFPGYGSVSMSPALEELVENLQSDVKQHVTRLESVLERLELVPERVAPDSSTGSLQELTPSRKVFVVHGRDNAAKESVARFIEKLGLEPIILHEQPNQGRTIIEKIEAFATVSFAVVLLTPDDVGSLGPAPGNLKPRARQNVILELGYFISRLGRPRVCALYVEGVELPSDFDGVLYVPLDSGGGWRLKLALEIRHSGINVDLNRAV